MFSNSRGLFPAYSGLGDVEVALPTSPSRSRMARDVEDLWKIHTESPHVTAPSDPGIGVPYPDNGFDPSKDLSENSPVNTLINRAASPLSSGEKNHLLSQLSDIYTEMLISNLQMSGMSPGEIKEMMQNKCAGSLLVYNGNDRDSLIKAYTLVCSLEELVENFVKNAQFSEDAKAEMLTFISPCPSIRDALVLPEHMIRQKLFGSTESRNHIEHALTLFGLSDETTVDGEPKVVIGEEFADFLEKINFAELELDCALQKDMISGDTHAAMYNALNQILPHIRSSDIRDILMSVVMHVRRSAEDRACRTSKSLALLISKLKKDLEEIGVDPHSIDRLVAKERMLRDAANAPISTPESASEILSRRATQRSPHDLRNLDSMLAQAASALESQIRHSNLHPRAKLCMLVELYTVMCMRDCCAAIASGANNFEDCASNLKGAVESALKASSVPSISSLKSRVDKSHKDLQYARKSKTMESLNRAKSEHMISDQKLETLRTLIG